MCFVLRVTDRRHCSAACLHRRVFFVKQPIEDPDSILLELMTRLEHGALGLGIQRIPFIQIHHDEVRYRAERGLGKIRGDFVEI